MGKWLMRCTIDTCSQIKPTKFPHSPCKFSFRCYLFWIQSWNGLGRYQVSSDADLIWLFCFTLKSTGLFWLHNRKKSSPYELGVTQPENLVIRKRIVKCNLLTKFLLTLAISWTNRFRLGNHDRQLTLTKDIFELEHVELATRLNRYLGRMH